MGSGRLVEAAAGINHQISFQGKVVNSNGTNVADNSYTFVFSIYSVASAGTAIWTETKSLAVADGVFQTNLGSVTALPGSVDFNSDSLYLGVEFNSDGEMAPRVRLTAVPYAFNSDAVGGVAAADLLRSTASDTFEGVDTRTLTVQSALTAGDRTANLLSITQANDTTYNMTSGALLGITNSDAGSAGNLLSLNNSGTGAALLFAEGTTVANGIQWGTDTNLYRSAANELKTEDALVVYGGPAVLGNTDTDANSLATTYTTSVIIGNTSTFLSGRTSVLIGRTSGNGTGLFSTAGSIVMQPRDGLATIFLEGGGTEAMRLTDAGQLQLYNTGSTGGLAFGDGAGGYDTNLYRSAADALKTDDNFTGLRLSSEQSASTSQSFSSLVTGDTFARYLVTTAGVINWGDGTNARDTNLYRSAANYLKTDDNLALAGSYLDLLTQADLRYYDADSSNYVAFQAPATIASDIVWTLPANDTAGCLSTDGSATLSWAACGGSGGAPTTAQYLTLALDGTLSAERVLTGTANQVVLTDGGANGNLTLSTPQDIHTAANPQFASIGLGTAANSLMMAYALNNAYNSASGVYGYLADISNLGSGAAYGLQAAARAVASGTGDLIGVYGGAVKNSNVAAALVNMVGVRAAVTVGTTGSVGTIKVLDVVSPTFSADGLVTDAYGIFVGDVGGIGAANDYGIAIAGADTQALWISSAADTTDAASGIAFGLSRDANLYRSAANTLKTDNLLAIAGVNAAGAGANALSFTGTLGIFDGSDTFSAINMAYTNANHTGASNNFYGVNIGNITGDTEANERALNIGTGWDYGMVSGSSLYVSKVNPAGTGSTGLTFGGTLGIMNGSDTVHGVNVAYVNSNHTGASNSFVAYNVAAITGDAEATETGLSVGTGWDYGLTAALAGTAAVNLSDTGGTAAGGLLLGADTNWYRGAANELRTDDLISFGSTKTNTVVDFKTYKTDGGMGFIFDTSSTYSTGSLMSVRNNTGAKFMIGATGNVIISGTLTQSSTPADVAENIQVSDSTIGGGDIVAIDTNNQETARKAVSSDARVLGVISTEPGILISGGTNGKPLVLNGRVPVKVVGGANIRVGDTVVVSSVAGWGTKAGDKVAPMVGVALTNQQAGVDTVIIQVQSGLYIPQLGNTLADSALSPQYQSILNSFTLLDNGLLKIADLTVERLQVASLTVNGQIVAGSLDLSDEAAGRGVIAAGQTSVFISTPLVETADKVLISPIDPGVEGAETANLYRGTIQSGVGFTVKLRPAQALSYDQPFDWLIIK